jgi:hypothetical protein
LENGELVGKISFKGVLVGGAVDVAFSFILGIPITLYAVSRIDLSHMPKDRASAAIASGIHANTAVYLMEVLVGSLCSVLGGYTAAFIARRNERLNGALSAYLCTAIGIFTIAFGKDTHSLAVQLILLVAGPLLSLMGGWVRLRQNSN